MNKRKVLLGSLVAAAGPAALAAVLLGSTAASAATTPNPNPNTTIEITSQGQLDNLVAQGNGTITKNIDVPASVTQADNIWLGWTHVTGNVTVEGTLTMTADVINGNVTVGGPGSQLWLANYASHITGNLTVHDSSGAWNGSAGTSFGDNTGYAGPDAATADGSSQVDGNFTYQNNTGWLYVGSPLRVLHNFTASGNTAYPAHWDTSGLTVSGKTSVS
jgi:hypothetical protein